MLNFDEIKSIRLLEDDVDLSTKVGSNLGLIVARVELESALREGLVTSPKGRRGLAQIRNTLPSSLTAKGHTELREAYQKYLYNLEYPSPPDYDDLESMLHLRSEIELCKDFADEKAYGTCKGLDPKFKRICVRRADDVRAIRAMNPRLYTFLNDHLWWRPQQR